MNHPNKPKDGIDRGKSIPDYIGEMIINLERALENEDLHHIILINVECEEEAHVTLHYALKEKEEYLNAIEKGAKIFLEERKYAPVTITRKKEK